MLIEQNEKPDLIADPIRILNHVILTHGKHPIRAVVVLWIDSRETLSMQVSTPLSSPEQIGMLELAKAHLTQNWCEGPELGEDRPKDRLTPDDCYELHHESHWSTERRDDGSVRLVCGICGELGEVVKITAEAAAPRVAAPSPPPPPEPPARG